LSSWPLSTAEPPAAGETFLNAGTTPTLAWLAPGQRDRPLVVFIPGAGHLARIAYGAPDADPHHFPAHWFAVHGFSFLALSYPCGHAAFPHADPGFGVADWATQVAAATAQALDSLRLRRPDVIVLAWSMAGRLLHRMRGALEQRGANLALFVSLDGHPTVADNTEALEALLIADRRGLAALEPLLTHFEQQLEEQRRLNDDEIISSTNYHQDYLAAFPVNLSATRLRHRSGEFVVDLDADVQDTQSLANNPLPPIAAVSGQAPSSADHALLDSSRWAYQAARFLLQNNRCALSHDASPAEHERARLTYVCKQLPAAFCLTVPGGHAFFIGQLGAERLVQAVEKLLGRWEQLLARLSMPAPSSLSDIDYRFLIG
jgi:hypothetical protein